jgi:undecaprenyl phosphate-alpha-L-ara4N flippase subunit ArnE
MININLLAIVLVVLGTLVGAIGSVYLKKGARSFNLRINEQIRNKQLVLGLVLFTLSSVAYIYALSLERLSLIYPLTSLTYIWVAFASVKFLGEKMNNKKWLGIILIMLGIVLITYFSA